MDNLNFAISLTIFINSIWLAIKLLVVANTRTRGADNSNSTTNYWFYAFAALGWAMSWLIWVVMYRRPFGCLDWFIERFGELPTTFTLSDIHSVSLAISSVFLYAGSITPEQTKSLKRVVAAVLFFGIAHIFLLHWADSFLVVKKGPASQPAFEGSLFAAKWSLSLAVIVPVMFGASLKRRVLMDRPLFFALLYAVSQPLAYELMMNGGLSDATVYGVNVKSFTMIGLALLKFVWATEVLACFHCNPDCESAADRKWLIEPRMVYYLGFSAVFLALIFKYVVAIPEGQGPAYSQILGFAILGGIGCFRAYGILVKLTDKRRGE